MNELDEQIRNLVQRAVEQSPVPPSVAQIETREASAARARRRLPNWGVAVVSGAVVLGLVVGAAVVLRPERDEVPPGGGPDDGQPAARWEEVTPSPLSPRSRTTMVWTGTEVLVLGGDTFTCPPGADCERADPESVPLLKDSAAFNPATNTWRRLADAPAGLSQSLAAVVGDDVFVFDAGVVHSFGQRTPPVLYRYSVPEDAWSTVESPGDVTALLAWRSDRLVAQLGPFEEAGVELWMLEPGSDSWSQLPASPLTGGYDTTTVAFEGWLYQFDHTLDHEADEPPPTRVARYWSSTRAWERLDDIDTLGAGPWLQHDEFLIAPEGGSADGGEVNNWGREVPNGGAFDAMQFDLSPLPPGVEFSAGAFSDDGALYIAASGPVLDIESWSWVTMPDLGHEPASIVAAGRDAFAFGGVDWDEGESHDPLGGAWIWRTGPAGPAPTSGTNPTIATAASVRRLRDGGDSNAPLFGSACGGGCRVGWLRRRRQEGGNVVERQRQQRGNLGDDRRTDDRTR